MRFVGGGVPDAPLIVAFRFRPNRCAFVRSTARGVEDAAPCGETMRFAFDTNRRRYPGTPDGRSLQDVWFMTGLGNDRRPCRERPMGVPGGIGQVI